MDKQTIVNFSGKLDMDSAHEVVKPEDYTYARNFDNNNQKTSTLGEGSNVLGTTTPENTSVGGTVVGRAKYEKENAEIVFVKIDGDSDEIRLVTEAQSQTILRADWLNFEDKLLNNPKCYDDYLIWSQENEEPRMLNIQWAKNYYEYVLFSLTDPSPVRVIKSFSEWDGTLSAPPALETIIYNDQVWLGDAQSPVSAPNALDPDWTLLVADLDQVYREITKETIQLIAKPPIDAIDATYGIDESFSSNNLYGKLYQFAYRYEYLDGRKSVYGSMSQTPYPANDETSSGVKPDLTVNNVLNLSLYTGGRDVAKIHIGMIDSLNPSSFKVIDVLEKYTINGEINSINGQFLNSDIYFLYTGFYNNEYYIAEELTELYKPQDYIPKIARTQDLLTDGRLLLGDINEEFDVGEVLLTADITNTGVDYTPGETYDVTQLSYSADYQSAFFGGDTTVYMDVFTLDFASDYKKGLVFQYNFEVKSTNGTSLPTPLNVLKSINLPYNNALSENDNRLIGMKLIADKIRSDVNNYAKYHEAYSSPSDAPSPTWFSSDNVWDWNQDKAKYPDDNDAGNDVIGYNRITAAHMGSTLYPAVPFAKLDTDIVILQKGYAIERFGAYSPWFLEVNITSPTILDVGTPVFESLKSNSRINIGIIYKDINLRKTGVLGKVALDTDFGYEGFSSDAFIRPKPIMSIDSVPPLDAHYYSFAVSENTIISDYLQVPVAAIDDQITELGLDLNTITADRLDANGKLIVSPWVFEPLDRIRFRAERVSDTTYDFEDKFDTEILREDTGKFYIETPVTSPAYVLKVGDLVEVYRLKKGVDEEDDVYFEIGGFENGNFEIINPGANTRRHSGNQSDQIVSYDGDTGITSSTTPAVSILEYGNCFLKNQLSINSLIPTTYTTVVESKYYSDYYISDFYDNGKPTGIIPINENTDNSTLIRFGGRILTESSNNYVSRFDFDDYDILSRDYGGIKGIRAVGDTVLIFQDTKVTSYYVNKTIIKESVDGSQTILSDKVLNDRSVSKDDYGCMNPESIIKKRTHILFFDAINGAFVRHANNGMFPISDYGIASFSKIVGDGVLNNGIYRYNIIGQYNERNDRYYFAINRAIDDNPANNYFEAFSFDNNKNQWKSFHDFTRADVGVEMLGSLNNYMTSYINGVPYIFNSSVYNTLFSEVKESEVTKAFNESPMLVKHWKYVTVNANSDWIPFEIGDVTTDNLTQTSRIRVLRNTEGRRSSDIKRNLFYPNGSLRPDENDGDIMLGRTMLITFRNSDTTKATISSVIVGYDLSEKVI